MRKVQARNIRVVYVETEQMHGDGYTAPTGWRIVNSEYVRVSAARSTYRVTIVNSQ